MNRFIILFTLCFLCSATTHAQGKDKALFFVVTDFDHWPDFPYSSAQQVRDVESELKSNYGFTTEFVSNPTKQKILDKLEEYSKKRFSKDDQLLIYFSMHGQYEEGSIGALVPKDGQMDDFSYKSWIMHPLLADVINRIKCKHITIALDACYSGTFGNHKGKPNKAAFEAEDCAGQRKEAHQYKSRLCFTSGGKERTPINSQFADKFLQALRTGHHNGVLWFHDVYAVLAKAKPQPRSDEFGDHEGGHFVFIRKDACGHSSPEKADNLHWSKVLQNPSSNKIREHLDQYPACRHYDQALNLIFANAGNNTILDKEPSATLEKSSSRPPDNMVLVEGGTFQMGSDEGDDDEKPIHKVTLSDFYLSRYEVSKGEFADFINETNYVTTAEEKGSVRALKDNKWQWVDGLSWKDIGFPQNHDHPVVGISWYDAVEYCNWLSQKHQYQKVYTINGDVIKANWNANGYRLPTEAEWEYAARSKGKDYKYAWGKKSTPHGNIADEKSKSEINWSTYWEGYNDGYVYTCPITSFEQGDLGLFNMTGNVWEWCWDWKDTYPSSAQTNPKGPDSGSSRVIRGGSWNSLPAGLRCANRRGLSPGRRINYLGFRLSRAAF